LTDKRVLYAEDDFLNGRLFEIILRHAGVDCDLAGDGKTALGLFKSRRYDVLILDAYLPGLNGEEIAREIRRENRKVPLIAVTSDSGAVESLYRTGFNRVFLKPLAGREWLDYVLGQL
jgi:DNA-binding response OmpR family regulator